MASAATRVVLSLALWTLASCSALPPMPSPSATPLHDEDPQGATDDAWSELIQRRQHEVSNGSRGDCPRSLGRDVNPAIGPAVGDGPIYAAYFSNDGIGGISESAKADGRYPKKILWVSDPSYLGVALVRGWHLGDDQPVVFDARGQTRVEMLRLPLEAWVDGGTGEGWREWDSLALVESPGCYAFQIDGEDFSDVMVVELVLAD